MSIHPSLISAGPGVWIQSPDGSLPGELWADYASIVLLEPEPELLGAWVRRLERKLARRARPKPWSILRVSPNMERKVAEALGPKTREAPHGAGLKVYVPMERFRPRNKLQARHRPLITGYIFALLENDEDLDTARKNHAVRDVMARDGKPVTVPALSIGALVLAEACRAFDTAKDTKPVRAKRGRRSAPFRNWQKGQRVKIVDGPFAGFVAEVVKADRADRMEMMVQLFDRETPIEMDEAMLEGWDAA